MINQTIVNILVDRIINGGINPTTGQPMKIEDIKSEEYRKAVEDEILRLTAVV